MSQLFDGKIKQRTFIAAPPEKVFEAITSSEAWDTFFTTGMTLEPKPGGECTFRWKDWGPDFYNVESPGKVVTVDPPKVFSFNWGSGDNETTVTFELEAGHGGTVVTCTEEGYRDTPDGRRMILECAAGWGEACTLLKFWLEHGIRYTAPKKV